MSESVWRLEGVDGYCELGGAKHVDGIIKFSFYDAVKKEEEDEEEEEEEEEDAYPL